MDWSSGERVRDLGLVVRTGDTEDSWSEPYDERTECARDSSSHGLRWVVGWVNR